MLIPVLLLVGCGELFPKRSAGEKLYRKYCAECHGVDGGGQTVRSMGRPNANLLDDRWRHAGDASGIANVINQQLVFEHPTFSKLDGPQVKLIADYVLELRGETR